VERARK